MLGELRRLEVADNACDIVALYRLALAEQVVVLNKQRNEVELEAARRRLDADADVGHAAGDSRSHGEMRELFGVVAVDPAAIDALVLQHLVECEMGAGAALPVDEARALGRDIFDGLDVERIAGRNEKSLMAADEIDDALGARFEPGLVFAQNLATERAFGNMEAGEFTAPFAKGDDAFKAADEANVELRSSPCPQEFAQFRKHEIVAREHGDGRVGFLEQFADLLLDFGDGAFEMRGETRVDALANP